jgi:retron-type reverse transcriptase
MKRVGNLFEQVIHFDNLYYSSKKAMQGTGKTKSTTRFFFHLENELVDLQNELKNGSYQPGAYRSFTIYDPKERTISVAPFRDRVVHHAIVNILTPIYEKSFIHDSYATRPGKGTHLAITRAQKWVRRWQWYLKSDIEKYFENVDHDILMNILKKKLKERSLLELLEKIIRNVPDSKGIPIGNLTSQFLANVYLNPFDHELKDHKRVPAYLRYMDDFVLFSDSKDYLKSIKQYMEEYLSNQLALKIKQHVTCIHRCSHGLNFLGMRIFPGYIRVKRENRKKSLKKISDQLQTYEQQLTSEYFYDDPETIQSIECIISHMRYFCSDIKIWNNF